MRKTYFIIVVIFLMPFFVFSQAPGCPNISIDDEHDGFDATE